MKVIGNKVLVKIINKEQISKGGIILNDGQRQWWFEGEVIGVGSGQPLESGERVGSQLKVGDRVVIDASYPDFIQINGVRHAVVREKDIRLVVDPVNGTEVGEVNWYG